MLNLELYQRHSCFADGATPKQPAAAFSSGNVLTTYTKALYIRSHQRVENMPITYRTP